MKYHVKITHLDSRVEELDVVGPHMLGAVVASAASGLPVVEETLDEQMQLVGRIEISRYNSTTGKLMEDPGALTQRDAAAIRAAAAGLVHRSAQLYTPKDKVGTDYPQGIEADRRRADQACDVAAKIESAL